MNPIKLTIAAFALIAMACGNAAAQDYPNREISLIVPFAAGGGTDAAARMFAQTMSEHIGQQVIVENVGGAGGLTGTNRMQRSRPDGYTFALINRPIAVFRPATDPNVTLLPREDYTPLALVAESPLVLLRHPNTAFSSLVEMIEAAKSNPGTVRYGTAGAGTTSHMAISLLQQLAGVELSHIPYQGDGPAMIDLLGERIEIVAVGPAPALQQIEAESLVPVAVTGSTRHPDFPDVPTIAEVGYTGYSFTTWMGFAAPVGIPDDILGKMLGALQATITDQALIDELEATGLVVAPIFGDAFADYLEHDLADFSAFAEEAGFVQQ